MRNDVIDVAQVRRLNPQAIVLSPGPCTPNEAGCSLSLVHELGDSYPILGVCLGHQTIAAALGGIVVRSPQPMHGRTSLIHHNGEGVFSNAPQPLSVCRYHSLIVEEASLPEVLEVTARTSDGLIMGLRHRSKPLVGLQFHPESILTDAGYLLLANFLRVAGIEPTAFPDVGDERPQPQAPTTTTLLKSLSF